MSYVDEDQMSAHEIDEGHGRFLDAMRSNSPDALMRELADDVVFYPPDQPPARGKAAVRAWYEGVLNEATTASVEVTDRDVVVAGDWGIEQGRYDWELVPTGGGDSFSARGHFIAIWHLQHDGIWRVSSDMWNNSGAP